MNLQALTNAALIILNENMVLGALIHRDVDNEPADFGDVVGGTCLNQHAYITFNAPNDDLDTCIELLLRPTMSIIAREIDRSLLSHTYEFFDQFITLDNIDEALLQVQKRIKDYNLFVSPWTETQLIRDGCIELSPSELCPEVLNSSTYLLQSIWQAQEAEAVYSFNLALHPNAMALVSRPLKPTKQSCIGINDHVAMRVSARDQEITCEVLYGTVVLDKTQGCVLYHKRPLVKKDGTHVAT